MRHRTYKYSPVEQAGRQWHVLTQENPRELCLYRPELSSHIFRSIWLGIVRIEVSGTTGLEQNNAVLRLAKTRWPRYSSLLVGTTGLIHQSGEAKAGHTESANPQHLTTAYGLVPKSSGTDQA
jgi:hypothetical protein